MKIPINPPGMKTVKAVNVGHVIGKKILDMFVDPHFEWLIVI